MITETFIGLVTGAVTALLPEIAKFVERHQKFDQQQKARKLGIADTSVLSEPELPQTTKVLVQLNETELTKSVRPIVTYLMFFTYVIIKFVILTVATRQGVEASALDDLIWDAEAQTILAALISFWFTDRSITKRNGK